MKKGSRKPFIYVIGSGQDDNVGDVVLRRGYFDELRNIGVLHIYVANASKNFIAGLQLGGCDVVYTSFPSWYRSAWRAAVTRRIWLADKPGELQLDRPTLLRQLVLFPLVLVLRVAGSHVLRLGIAVRSVNPRFLMVLGPLLRLSTRVGWRDTTTGAALGFGSAIPDWAFAWSGTAKEDLERERSAIAITYRGDRPLPSSKILDAIAAVARADGRRMIVVHQVERDGDQSQHLASLLDAELVQWPAHRPILDQEQVVRELYRTCELVVSDRLHALIVAMTEGAVPLCITESGENKVERHLDAVGYKHSTLSVAGMTVAEIEAEIRSQIARRPEVLATIKNSRTVLDSLMAELVTPALPLIGDSAR